MLRVLIPDSFTMNCSDMVECEMDTYIVFSPLSSFFRPEIRFKRATSVVYIETLKKNAPKHAPTRIQFTSASLTFGWNAIHPPIDPLINKLVLIMAPNISYLHHKSGAGLGEGCRGAHPPPSQDVRRLSKIRSILQK